MEKTLDSGLTCFMSVSGKFTFMTCFGACEKLCFHAHHQSNRRYTEL